MTDLASIRTEEEAWIAAGGNQTIDEWRTGKPAVPREIQQVLAIRAAIFWLSVGISVLGCVGLIVVWSDILSGQAR